MQGNREPNLWAAKPGTNLSPWRITLDNETYQAYNRLKKEINPLHFDRDYARKIGFDEIVVAGLYTFSFVPRYVEEFLSEEDRIERIEIRFKSPIYVDTEIAHEGTVRAVSAAPGGKAIDIDIAVVDVAGNVLTEARVRVLTPL